ncbi:hypothetical protein GUJ93_ZPchr0009g399 [Zizania palustris]|uniref:Uncharacterized protein n=1 Tax=Zizania palustris TaxID=103762 RepID=A0A8J5RKF0_ZIZPA|nr:hypothetical protein GUJ93_ZPchr0009g399 [Zizania palustris]
MPISPLGFSSLSLSRRGGRRRRAQLAACRPRHPSPARATPPAPSSASPRATCLATPVRHATSRCPPPARRAASCHRPPVRASPRIAARRPPFRTRPRRGDRAPAVQPRRQGLNAQRVREDGVGNLEERESRKEIEAQGEKLRCLERELQASQRQVAEQQWRILHLQFKVQPRRRTKVTARMSMPLPQEQQRFVMEILEETGECAAVAPTPVPASAPQGDQPMGEDSEDPMEEFFEESRTKGPLIGYTPTP